MSSALLSGTPATDLRETEQPAVPLEVRRLAVRRRRFAARVRSWARIVAVAGVSMTLVVLALFSFLGH